MKKAMLTVAAMTLFAATSAQAADVPTRPEMRVSVQEELIFTALWQGTLGWKQAKALLDEQDAVATWLARFREDGRVSVRETRALEYMLDISSRNIDLALRTARSDQPKKAPTEDVRDLVASLDLRR